MGKNSKDKRDVYNRLAKEGNWRARSVYKLIQVNEEMHILDHAANVVDLCAAPGSWSQALQKILSSKNKDYKIVSVDLQKIEPIPGVITLIGDITKESTALEIIANFNQKLADVVVCDGAADITGIHSLDESFHYFIFTAAMAITSHLLSRGGHFVIKIFQGIHSNNIMHQLGEVFEEVRIIKPPASRQASAEAFLVAKNYRRPKFFKADLSQPDKILIPQYELSFEERMAEKLLKYVMYGGYSCNDSNEIKKTNKPPHCEDITKVLWSLSDLKLKNMDKSLDMNLNACIVDIREKSVEMIQNYDNQENDNDEFTEFFTQLTNNCRSK